MRHATPSPAALRDLAAQQIPFVATGLCDNWAARNWQLQTLSNSLAPRADGIRHYCRRQLQQACDEAVYVCERDDWRILRVATRQSHVYRRARAIFARGLDCIFAIIRRWRRCLRTSSPRSRRSTGRACSARSKSAAPRDGSHTTLWLGSGDASTPLHYDTYGGANWVAQLVGTKRWRLHPPMSGREEEPHELMRPSRVPYEESSVFARERASGSALPDAPMASNNPPHLPFVWLDRV